MEKISAIIITKNEQGNIEPCLESLNWVDEIILVDQSSTDKTAEIAKKFTDKIYIVEPKGLCEPDREFAVSKTKNNWVLYIDADERVSLALRGEIESLFNNSKEKLDSYFIPRKVFLGEKWIRGCGWSPSLTIRLFKKDKACFSDEIFTDAKPLGSYGYLKEHILHYSYKDLEEYLFKLNRYTGILADKEYKNGLRVNEINFILLFIIKPAYWFLKKFFFLKGFLDGSYGFFISFFTAIGIIVTYAKVWEKQHTIC